MITVSIAKKKLKAKGEYALYLDYRIDGQRKRQYLKLHWISGRNKDNAKVMEVAEARRRELSELLNSRETKAFSLDITFSNYVSVMGGFYEANTKRVHQASLRIINALFPNLKIRDIDRTWFKQFIAHLVKRKNHPNTIIQRCCFVKSVLHKAKIDGIINSVVDLKGLLPSSVRSNRTFLTIDEIKKLVDTDIYRPIIKSAFLFSCFTGLRISDIMNLTYGNIDNNVLQIQMKKTKEYIQIPLSENALKYLPPREPTEVLIFPNMPKGRCHLNRILKRWAKDAGVKKDLSFHIARHTFATMTLKFCGNLYTVSKLLGHSKIETTAIYAKCVLDEKVQAVNAVPKI